MKLSEHDINIIANYMADWWAERLMQGDKVAFHESLKTAITKELSAWPDRPYVSIECDYDPQGPLLDAVRAAGLKCDGYLFSARGILPQKHDTSIYPERVAEPEFETEAAPARFQAKEGYGNWKDPIPLADIIAGRSALGANDGA